MSPWTALARVLARPRVVAALAALNVGLTLLAAQPLATALAPLLDARPAAHQLVAGPDDGLLAELLIDHPELVRQGLLALALALVAHALLSSVAAGAALAAWGPAETRGARALTAAAARAAKTRVAVAALFLPLRLVAGAAAAGAWLLVWPLARDRGFAALAAALAAAALVGGALWSISGVALDYALAGSDGETALRAARGGLVRAWRRRGRTLALAAFWGVGFVALTAIYHLLAAPLPLLPTASFALLVALRLSLAGARAALTAATLIAAAATPA
jgi:hypothetical protein